MSVKLRDYYISKEFLVNFFFSLVIFSFIFSLQAIFQIIELLVKGTFYPSLVIGVFFILLFSSFTYIMPLTFLYASTSLFSRLSSDRELLILSSTGISSFKLVRTLMIFALFAVFFLLAFNLFILPEMNYKKRDMIYRLKFKNPLSLLQEKNVVNGIPGITIYTEKIFRNFRLKNIAITYSDKDRVNFLKAESGMVRYDAEKNNLIFNLRRGFAIIYDSVQTISRLNFDEYRFVFPLPSGFNDTPARTDISDMRLSALVAKGGLREMVEVHDRIIFSVMPLIFVLLGSGIGIKLKQQSKMLHIGLGGGLTLLFLQFMILGETLSYTAGTPVLTWIPVLLFIIIGGIFLKWK
jgi:lipopolysaccharide export system permease protein